LNAAYVIASNVTQSLPQPLNLGLKFSNIFYGKSPTLSQTFCTFIQPLNLRRLGFDYSLRFRSASLLTYLNQV
jgi:hypothetical protein